MTKNINLNYVSDPQMCYPKMNTLYKRDKLKGYKIIEGDYSKDEFLLIKKWHVTEKIDGINVRIFYNGCTDESLANIQFRGRRDNSNMPSGLHKYLVNHFTEERMYLAFGESKVVLFGEGYGPGIQKGGGLYRDTPGFILFDVNIAPWWLEYDNICAIARILEIPFVQSYGFMGLNEIVEFVKNTFHSKEAPETKMPEGIIATSVPLLLFRNGYPLKFKLKIKDFD